jgi:post-segregation antitoxin (ccd killing protein)
MDADETKPGPRPRLHVRLSAESRAELSRRARAGGIAVSALARELIETELDRSASSEMADTEHALVGLAALTAAELAALMVASVLPEGERRMHELGAQAAIAAQERLALFRDRAGE